MLKGISPLLNAEVLYALRAMGHGDDLIVCDTNFPADSIARQTQLGELLRIDNVTAGEAVAAILSVYPLDRARFPVKCLVWDPPFNTAYSYDVYDDRRAASAYVAWIEAVMATIEPLLVPKAAVWVMQGDEYVSETDVVLKAMTDPDGRPLLQWRNKIPHWYSFGQHGEHKFVRSHVTWLYYVEAARDEPDATRRPALRMGPGLDSRQRTCALRSAGACRARLDRGDHGRHGCVLHAGRDNGLFIPRVWRERDTGRRGRPADHPRCAARRIHHQLAPATGVLKALRATGRR